MASTIPPRQRTLPAPLKEGVEKVGFILDTIRHVLGTDSQLELEGLLSYWQPRLGMWDWSISVKEVEDLGDCKATVQFNREERTAHISVEKGTPRPDQRIVHELLHLMFTPLIPADSSLDDAEESVVGLLVSQLAP